jgi:hypothetical protein
MMSLTIQLEFSFNHACCSLGLSRGANEKADAMHQALKSVVRQRLLRTFRILKPRLQSSDGVSVP